MFPEETPRDGQPGLRRLRWQQSSEKKDPEAVATRRRRPRGWKRSAEGQSRVRRAAAVGPRVQRKTSAANRPRSSRKPLPSQGGVEGLFLRRTSSLKASAAVSKPNPSEVATLLLPLERGRRQTRFVGRGLLIQQQGVPARLAAR